MITAISWKNVWRNRTRSFVVVVAVTLGTIAGVFVAGLMNGWVAQRINSSIYTEQGHLKIQNPDYLINEEAKHSIQDYEKVIEYLNNSDEVVAYSSRSKIMSVATTSRGTTGIMLKGIDPDNEKQVSDLYTKLIPNTGTYFESKSKLPPVLISDRTAEQLKIKNFRVNDKCIDSLVKLEVPEETISKLDEIKDKRFITKKKFEKKIEELWTAAEVRKYGPALTKTAAYYQKRARISFSFTKTTGDIGYQTFQVCGIYKTSNGMFDMLSAFVKNEDLYNQVGLADNQFHEISILIKDKGENLDAFYKQTSTDLSEASVMTWKELAPDAGMMADFMQIYYYIIMGIIFFALAFGIINTMLMAILERIKELGMLMAIGMKKKQVFWMIMLETVFLTLTGSVVGMMLGGAIIKITGRTGLNFASVEEGFEAMGFSALIYPSIDIVFFFGVTVMVIGIAILSSIIPARKALKLRPVDAIRIE